LRFVNKLLKTLIAKLKNLFFLSEKSLRLKLYRSDYCSRKFLLASFIILFRKILFNFISTIFKHKITKICKINHWCNVRNFYLRSGARKPDAD